ncbi:MAG: AI-2E family transporter [Lachnospiraceae bacterium]
MFFGGSKRESQAAKWIIQVVTACILVYLGIRHLDVVAGAITWLVNLFKPLLLGIIFALVLNVPMCPIEKILFQKRDGLKAQKARRGMAIVLSLFLVFSIFLGVAFLVIPEILDAIPLVNDNILRITEQIDSQNRKLDIESFTFIKLLPQLDIDWSGIRTSLNNWFMESRSTVMNYAMEVAAEVGSALVNVAIGLVFSIYFLYNKEKLKRQTGHLIKVWLPTIFGQGLIHVASVFSLAFKSFIAGQTIEAIILGTLCTVGMFLLRLPYAPMVGALVGVTALIPIVGAWTGTIVGAFIILTVDPFKALVFVIFFVILQQVEGNVIYPRVVGSSIGLSAIWVLAAITVGGRLAGPIGMFLGVPAVSALYTLLKEATIWKEHHPSPNKNKLPQESKI